MNLATSFCMDTGQVRTGADRRDTYLKMLQQIVRVTAPVAHGIAAQYPDVQALVQAFRDKGPTALQHVKVSFFFSFPFFAISGFLLFFPLVFSHYFVVFSALLLFRFTPPSSLPRLLSSPSFPSLFLYPPPFLCTYLVIFFCGRRPPRGGGGGGPPARARPPPAPRAKGGLP